jgi:hypothetical protein
MNAEPYLNAPLYIGPPEACHDCSTRRFQGIPAIERAANGRLWAAWYGGGVSEDNMNYVMLATSQDDGQTWTPPVLVIDPDAEGPVRAFDPCLWHDPNGLLWLFWSQGYQGNRTCKQWGVWAITTAQSGSDKPEWSAPVRICDGILMNKPTVLAGGEWLLPVAHWFVEGSAGVVASVDQGGSWKWRGRATVPDPADRNCDEHMIVERCGGSLWMLVRTRYGIGESISTDGGWTWTPVTPTSIAHTASRFFIRRLKSGRLLLVKHGNIAENTGRTLLKAFVSADDGLTWSRGLLLDGRLTVSYPDGVESADGTQYVIYDFDRFDTKEIRLAVFSEQAILAGGEAKITLVNKALGETVRRRTPVRIERVGGQPLLTPASNPKLGTNLNGPCLIRVPDWVPNPLGRYYLYFAHHQGAFIRMAYADAIQGPYHVYDPGVLDLAATPFSRHIASPELIVDHEARKIRMLYHGSGPTEANPAKRGQSTTYAESSDGLRFVSERQYLAEPYLRVFRKDGWWYGFSGGGDRRLSRSRQLNEVFEHGPVLDIEGEPYAACPEGQSVDRIYRTRHVAFQLRGDQLAIYYSNVGDAPERIKRTVVSLAGDWTTWRGAKYQEVLRPEMAYEGADEPFVISVGGSKHTPVNEVRDPYVFEEEGVSWLFYSVAGEQGIGLARLVDPEVS